MSAKESAARATGLTIALVLVSRILGVVRDIVITSQFGQNETTTIYKAAFRVPDLIALVIAGGALSSVFVPIFTEYWTNKREADAWKVFGSVMSITAVVVTIIVGAMELLAHPLTHLLNPRFSPDALERTTALTRILLPAQWFLLVGGLMSGTLYARKNFLIPALSPIIYNLGGIIGGLFFGRSDLGIASMAWGTLSGAILGNFLLPLVALFGVGVRWRLGFDIRHPGVRRVGATMLPVLLGLSLSPLILFITGFFLPNDDRLSVLGNAFNLTQAPIGIFAQAFAIVLFPTISALAAQKNWVEFRKTVSLGIRRVLFLTVPASFLMAVLAEPLIRVLYRRQMFNEHDVHQLSVALLCYSVATFAWSALSILARGFYAVQDTRTPVFITTPMVFVFVFFCWLSRRLEPDGFQLLALSASLVGIITLFLFMGMLQKRVGNLGIRYIIASATKTLFATVVASAAAEGLLRLLQNWAGTDSLRSFLLLLVAGSGALLVYFVMALTLRMPELVGILEMVRRPRGAAANAPPEV